MPVIYNKLFKLLIDLNIKKGELQRSANLTSSIMARLAKNETVRTDTIGKICDALGCQPGDIMEYVYYEEVNDKDGQETDQIAIYKPQLDAPETPIKIISKRELT